MRCFQLNGRPCRNIVRQKRKFPSSGLETALERQRKMLEFDAPGVGTPFLP
jgi:hypothetical protein